MRQKWKSERFKAWEGLDGHCWPWRWRKGTRNWMRVASRSWGPRLTVIQSQGPQSYTCRELNLANNLNEFGSRLFPEFADGRALGSSLVKTGTEKPAKPAWVSALHNWEKISLQVRGNLLQQQQTTNTHTQWVDDRLTFSLTTLYWWWTLHHTTRVHSLFPRCTKHFTPWSALLLML